MVQICEYSEEVKPVRRMLYLRASPAGQGIRWDWLGDRISEWIDYEMDAQDCIEAAWVHVSRNIGTCYGRTTHNLTSLFWFY